jgi:hypothetical protein
MWLEIRSARISMNYAYRLDTSSIYPSGRFYREQKHFESCQLGDDKVEVSPPKKTHVKRGRTPDKFLDYPLS